MLTVLIETRNDEEGLARTLASLVGGAVEGVVRDVIVCDRGSTDQTHRVAEHAGCHYRRRAAASRPASARPRANGCCCSSPARGWSTAGPTTVVAHTAQADDAGAVFACPRQPRAVSGAGLFAPDRRWPRGW